MTGLVGGLVEGPFRLPVSPARSDLVAKYFRGLGDQTRVRILELLRDEGELSVGELVERLGLPQPKVSNHLACLRWCGFVEARREHRTVYNRIADKRVLKMLALAQALLDDNAEHVAACCRIDGR
jgi:ArsR family transcriptional regulator, cadmium/lead-responsive transcriptional repressor